VYIQNFLSELLLMVLSDNTEEQVLDKITQFRNEFKQDQAGRKDLHVEQTT